MGNKLLEKKGLIIAGPCSAESEEQLICTAKEIAKIKGVNILRAGIWKPRTNPGGFEGVGTKGLAWLDQAKKETGLLTATEVATTKHVEDALHFGVDVLWIGARTSVNPFSVQSIADVLRGTNKTVLIKNPVNPDLKLWIGAVERIQQVGITDIGLIHRGFTSCGNKEYRNTPMWHIPMELKRIFPTMPMVCDPSHITGNRNTIEMIAQKSLNLNYDGLMIETHYNPDEAWTDKDQQVSPQKLDEILSSLNWKNSEYYTSDFEKKLEILRDQINNFDDELLSLIHSRMLVAENIGTIKSENDLTVLQNNRWSLILERMINQSQSTKLSKNFVRSLMELLHAESIRIQNEKIQFTP